MTDIIKQLESGIEINGVYQRIIEVLCYIDIPIQVIISKLELVNNKENDFFEFLNYRSPVIIKWIESNSDKTLEIQDYINFLQNHSETTRDFVRFALNIVSGMYIKIPTKDEEFIGLDEDYIKSYNDIVSRFDLVMEPISTSVDLRKIPSNQVRPTLKWSERPDESIKTIFIQTSFKLKND